MFLDLKDIDRDGVAFDHRPRWAALEGPDGAACPVADVRMTGEIVPGPRGLELRGRVSATVDVACDRCLDRVTIRCEDDVFLVLVAETMDEGPGERGIEVEDTDLYPVEGGRLDVDALAREAVYLLFPARTVCSEGCKGLCPECGANRNQVDCGCAEKVLDPRLAPLLRLKHTDESKD